MNTVASLPTSVASLLARRPTHVASAFSLAYNREG
jgi:hypothetical protein